VEGDGDEENDELCACRDGDGHADEDAVEEDAGFEEQALQEESLRIVLFLVRGLVKGVVVVGNLATVRVV